MKNIMSEKRLIIGAMSDGQPRSVKELEQEFGFTRAYLNIREMNEDDSCRFKFLKLEDSDKYQMLVTAAIV